ncbi:MAG: hypothetical protein JO057_08220, partial [Chloroflexi bacterium]|nr:hypothetical protein [Chloroflexota bacterium]
MLALDAGGQHDWPVSAGFRRRRADLVAEDSAQTDELRDASIFGARPRLLESELIAASDLGMAFTLAGMVTTPRLPEH